PTFTSQTGQDNAGAAYSEKFNTVRGQFATFVQRIPETVDSCTGSPIGCSPSSPFTTCNGSIMSPYSGDVIVPINGVCVITASVHNVFVMTGANLTVVGATINGDLIGNYSQSITLRNAPSLCVRLISSRPKHLGLLLTSILLFREIIFSSPLIF